MKTLSTTEWWWQVQIYNILGLRERPSANPDQSRATNSFISATISRGFFCFFFGGRSPAAVIRSAKPSVQRQNPAVWSLWLLFHSKIARRNPCVLIIGSHAFRAGSLLLRYLQTLRALLSPWLKLRLSLNPPATEADGSDRFATARREDWSQWPLCRRRTNDRRNRELTAWALLERHNHQGLPKGHGLYTDQGI